MDELLLPLARRSMHPEGETSSGVELQFDAKNPMPNAQLSTEALRRRWLVERHGLTATYAQIVAVEHWGEA